MQPESDTMSLQATRARPDAAISDGLALGTDIEEHSSTGQERAYSVPVCRLPDAVLRNTWR